MARGAARGRRREELGRHPWDAPSPIALDTSAARDIGYRPVGDYATTVNEEVRWLVCGASRDPEAQLPPGLDEAFFHSMLNYDLEDRYLATG